MSCFACCGGFLNIFGYCAFGKSATEQFDQLPNYLFESNWPNSPLKLQKYFILMLADAQQPMQFVGFRIVILNLETFTKVGRVKSSVQNVRPNVYKILNFFSDDE